VLNREAVVMGRKNWFDFFHNDVEEYVIPLLLLAVIASVIIYYYALPLETQVQYRCFVGDSVACFTLKK
jgi:hypothetical protein